MSKKKVKRNANLPHKHNMISVKEAEVDEGIANLVMYFNSFDGIYTLHSCEGDKLTQPYITFISLDQDNLFEFIKATRGVLGCFGRTYLEAVAHQGHIKYTIRLENEQHLDEINKLLDGGNV